jgi:ribose transport system ATP-binding protein
MKILSGVYRITKDKFFQGKPVHFSGTAAAQQAGIAIIHQELNLIPWLSIRENIFLGKEILTPFGFLDKKAMQLKTTELLHALGVAIDPDTKVAR